MKKVTITLKEEVARWAMEKAAERNTSVSRLLGEILQEKMQEEEAYRLAMEHYLALDRTTSRSARAWRNQSLASMIMSDLKIPKSSRPSNPRLEELTNLLKPYDPEKIILFGSRARGEANSYSDYDVASRRRTELF